MDLISIEKENTLLYKELDVRTIWFQGDINCYTQVKAVQNKGTSTIQYMHIHYLSLPSIHNMLQCPLQHNKVCTSTVIDPNSTWCNCHARSTQYLHLVATSCSYTCSKMVLTLCNLSWCFSSHQLAQVLHLHSWWSSPAATCAGDVFLEH